MYATLLPCISQNGAFSLTPLTAFLCALPSLTPEEKGIFLRPPPTLITGSHVRVSGRFEIGPASRPDAITKMR